MYADENAILDTTVVKEILSRYVQLTKGGGFIPNEEFHKLNNAPKIIVTMLCRKVAHLKEGFPEEIAPKEVENLTGIKRGSVTATMPGLEKKGLAKSDNGKYWIPNYSISKLKAVFNGK